MSYIFDGESLPLSEYTEKAYLDYSMYVILDRALPHIGDGLKPVQRRIVYAMSELGLKSTSKHKKSARTVGDVLGKFHPHGDSACYEAMVLMAQPFSYRYPLVDGQGNWGSPDDPKSFAAMRYTESRLSAYTKVLLDELGQGTVDWQPNFDASLEEPKTLPARLPNILLNGGMGIAVGMSTNIPPHNLKEVGKACIKLLKKPDATQSEILKIIKGPDFPTKAEIITPQDELKTIYKTGNGSIKMRAVYSLEDKNIVISALPHQVSGSKVLEQIAAQINAKKLPMVSDIRDESDHEQPIRFVIEPRSNRVDIEQLMGHLFATTDLEKSYRVNLNVIGLDGRPKVMGLMELLDQWLDYRFETVTRRVLHRLNKVKDRLHILEGLMAAFLNIDEVIAIIRDSDQPKQDLMNAFNLTDIQATAILDLRLRQIAKLEEIKIQGERDELELERKGLQAMLDDDGLLKQQIISEIEEDIKTYGDERMSPIVERQESKQLSEMDLIPSESVTVVLSKMGWVRSAKGHDVNAETLSYKSGDDYLDHAQGKSNQLACFIDSQGKSYSLPAHSLPSARGQGEPLTGRLTPAGGSQFVNVIMADDKQKMLLATTHGYGFITEAANLQTQYKAGKALLTVPAGAEVLPPIFVPEFEVVEESAAPLFGDYPPGPRLAVITSQGRLLCFHISELPELSKGKGNKLIGIPAADIKSGEESVVAVAVISESEKLIIQAGKRHMGLKYKELEEYFGQRAQRGKKLPRGYQNVDAAFTEV